MTGDPVVLYVEDDPQSRRIMQVLLTELMGLSTVTIFEDSADFLARVQALWPQPDVVLLDIHVRPNNGFDMLQMLRSQSRFHETPIVALTASVMNEEVKMLRVAGFSGVIAKPIDLDTFPGVLERVLNGEKIWRVVG